MISADTDTLLALLDREFRFFLGQTDPKRQLIFVARLLDWLEREPRLSALLGDTTQEELQAASAFREERRQMHSAITQLWEQHSQLLKERLAGDRGRGVLEAYGSIDGFDARCGAEPEMIDTVDAPREDRTNSRKLIDCLRHWAHWASGKAEEGESGPEVDALDDLNTHLQRLDQRQRYAFRRFQAAARYLPGAAFARLKECRERVQLEPPPSNLSDAELGAWWGTHLNDVRFSDAVHSETAQALNSDGDDAVEAAARRAQQDAELLCHELRQRLLLGWSRRALVRRYAARCQAFESERLRAVADATRQPEAELTRDFARYLFDQGLTPLLEAPIAHLRPDLIDTGHQTMFYVEGKQYKDSSPRSMLIGAYRQVWSTWSRLRHQYHCPEAFLVVFRRSGPLVELPPQLVSSGLVLHSVLVDLSEQAGSAESKDPIRLSVEELLPKDND